MLENWVFWGIVMCYHFLSLVTLLERRYGSMQALSSEYKLSKLILQVGCPSRNLTTQRKSALILKAFNQHDTAGEAVTFLGINALAKLILFQDVFLWQTFPKNICRVIPQGHDNTIWRPSESFIITRTVITVEVQKSLILGATMKGFYP